MDLWAPNAPKSALDVKGGFLLNFSVCSEVRLPFEGPQCDISSEGENRSDEIPIEVAQRDNSND